MRGRRSTTRPRHREEREREVGADPTCDGARDGEERAGEGEVHEHVSARPTAGRARRARRRGTRAGGAARAASPARTGRRARARAPSRVPRARRPRAVRARGAGAPRRGSASPAPTMTPAALDAPSARRKSVRKPCTDPPCSGPFEITRYGTVDTSVKRIARAGPLTPCAPTLE